MYSCTMANAVTRSMDTSMYEYLVTGSSRKNWLRVIPPLVRRHADGIQPQAGTGHQCAGQVIGLSNDQGVGNTKDVQRTITGVVGKPSGKPQDHRPFRDPKFQG